MGDRRQKGAELGKNVGIRQPIAVVALVIACLHLGSCGSKSPSKDQPKAEPTRPPIKGYGGLEFGASFTGSIGRVGGDRFNSVAVSECFKDLPLKGCYLSRNMDGTPFNMKAGIPYTLALSFNKFDKLTDIDLDYDREGDISKADCLGIHERTLDWLVADYGPFAASDGSQKSNVGERRQTPQKHTYNVSFMESGSFVTAPMRTVPNSASLDRTKPITTWGNERYISLLSTYIVVDGKPICGINVSFSEPQSVERRKDSR